MTPLRLSVTQIETYLSCPRKWAYRYVERIKTPASAAMVQGRAWHKAIETSYRRVIDGAGLMPVEDAAELAVAEFDGALAKEEVDLMDDTPEQLRDDLAELTRVHQRELAPRARPHAVEVEFTVDMWGDGTTLFGIVDLVEEDGTIVDNKTWSPQRVPSPEKLENGLQLGAYAMASQALTGRPVPALRLDGVVKATARRKPEARRLETTRTQAQLAAVVDVVDGVAKGIRAEAYPANNSGPLCSEKWCGFFRICPSGGKR